ncbi:hypothetical protein A3A93_00545 [Candidatus Roizmanbacteria bacterium RIFCSPLOWO2_01_FULL_38_12]|uniref:Uncharacterized protein n=1 Tax=Candidatus Roizmanbacteria bacterium RIFCSPLOWO2_01_FULL_38_12 TaxID=1802061 RepID=A0A1F7IXP2_9BACT|nr:MAG: hypothetical protein A2861_00225 [Candidatus Roizmanbacteria bacterium RIFCSPHIGHO2_01_FULL_38_15]OGK36121.1 MAG: hypothetical protein A3F59_01470 [Candidatus Roizmanbacteria bacterium RIFCSPHIGHO2_12_FULL_38_13]OGK48166.1 MAG: hypothetical protein A3A93_00545 [Candidatus Roizmanbacteria bacterium RIFCSPLOWO2_01_FULL_38_12]
MEPSDLSNVINIFYETFKSVGEKLSRETAKKYAKDNKFINIRLLTNPHLNSFVWYKKMGFIESGWIEVFKAV